MDVRLEYAMDVRIEHVPHCGCASRVHIMDLRLEHALDVRIEYVPHFGCAS